MSGLRILAIAPTGFFADYGCHVRIRGQLSALAARGHTIRLVTYPTGREVAGLRTARPPWWPRARPIAVGSSWPKVALDAVLAPTALAAALRFPGGRPQVIHAYLHEGALIGWALARILRGLGAGPVPVVFDFQGSLTAEMLDHRFLRPDAPALPLLQKLERFIDQRPAALLASSGQAAQLLAQRYGVPAGRIHTLHDSVDPALFRPREGFAAAEVAALRQRLGLPTGLPVVAYLGLLAPYQGTELLLQALQQLADDPTPPHGLVMGFPDVDRYRQLAAALGLAGRVTFTGAVPYEEAPLHLSLGDVAAAPKLSATEGSGKLLTYMAAGLPVAAFDTPVHREYLGELGYYAVPGDARSLAAAIRAALGNPVEARERGRALRRRVEGCFTWERAAEQIEGVYEGVR